MLPDWSVEFDMRRKPAAPLGFGPFGERPPVPANDQGSTLSRSVSDDLEAIFAEVPPPTATRRPARVHSVAPQKPEASLGAKTSKITAWGGMIAAAVAGVVVGTILVKQPPKAPPPPAAVVAGPAPAAKAPTDRELAPPPAAPARAVASGEVKTTPARPAAKAKPAPVRTRPAAMRTPTRSAVLGADRDLRQAYAAASKAGVPRGRLISVRNRWTALRAAPPARLIAGYAALTRELRQQTASARSHPRRRGFFG